VLVTAVVAVGVASREGVRPVREAEPVRRALALVLVPVLLVLALWILVAGSSQPGGAFQAGALGAAALVIAHLCGIPFSTPRGRGALALAGGGVVAFVLLGVIGLAATGAWLGLDPAWAGAAILAIEAVLAVSIAVALAGIFLAAGAVDADRDEVPA
jgi:multisubunit Na+/H+ antiporter MnhB subunit